jgi:hypothetical protein
MAFAVASKQKKRNRKGRAEYRQIISQTYGLFYGLQNSEYYFNPFYKFLIANLLQLHYQSTFWLSWPYLLNTKHGFIYQETT